MNKTQQNTLNSIFTSPVNGNMAWRKIESLLLTLGAVITEGTGSRVSFVLNDVRVDFHRLHPGKEALRYRVKLTREFLINAGIQP